MYYLNLFAVIAQLCVLWAFLPYTIILYTYLLFVYKRIILIEIIISKYIKFLYIKYNIQKTIYIYLYI